MEESKSGYVEDFSTVPQDLFPNKVSGTAHTATAMNNSIEGLEEKPHEGRSVVQVEQFDVPKQVKGNMGNEGEAGEVTNGGSGR